MSTTKNDTDAIRTVLSKARMSTYDDYLKNHVATNDALQLYAWNAKVSGLLLMPLHICEVATRNAVSDALQAVYGESWPWSPTFEGSLPINKSGYSPRDDLQRTRQRKNTTGKVIAELKFSFWQHMFTSRYDTRIWNSHLLSVIRYAKPSYSVKKLRVEIYRELNELRLLRNRIAHHEPIFKRDLKKDYNSILNIVHIRCPITAQWLDTEQYVTSLLDNFSASFCRSLP